MILILLIILKTYLVNTVSKSKKKESPKEEVNDEVISPEEAGVPAVFLCLVSS